MRYRILGAIKQKNVRYRMRYRTFWVVNKGSGCDIACDILNTMCDIDIVCYIVSRYNNTILYKISYAILHTISLYDIAVRYRTRYRIRYRIRYFNTISQYDIVQDIVCDIAYDNRMRYLVEISHKISHKISHTISQYDISLLYRMRYRMRYRIDIALYDIDVSRIQMYGIVMHITQYDSNRTI